MINSIRAARASLVLCVLSLPLPVWAQNTGGGRANSRSALDAPAPAPIAPETITRSPEGAVTVRAVRIPEGLRVDGHLDESYYRDTLPLTGFTQQDPLEGAPVSERTEAWIFFDDTNIYVSARCWDLHPERLVANEMRRDSNNILQNENFAIVFDTFHDKRNSVFFHTNPLGAQRDTEVTDETTTNPDWNTVWDVRTQRSDQGWTVEFAIPFKSLRYSANPVQVWGFNLRRIIKHKNEFAFLAPMPSYLAARAIQTVSMAATLVGLETPPSALNLEVKPYGISGLRTDLKARDPFSNKGDKDFGADVKYAVTKALTLDLTYNTDFAQVEDDTQQVNLTRFNLQFPERREFFLEGQGLFAFGGSAVGNTPVMFFSRRIGLNNGRPVPIAGGGRITGRVGGYSVGILNIQSREDELSDSRSTNFTVVRLKRNLLRRSNIGVLYTRRDETTGGGAPTGQTFGVDGLYSFSPALNVNAYYARTEKPGETDRNTSYLARVVYNADRYGFQVERLMVGEHFNPEVGFVRRTDLQRSFALARFSPRPAKGRWMAIRRFIYSGSVEYIENNTGRLEFREQEGQFEIERNNSDRVTLSYTRDYEFIPKAFEISTGVTVPVGGYTYQSLLASYMLGPQRVMSGTVSFQQGPFYGGTKRVVGLGTGRLKLTSQLALEPSVSANWVDLPQGSFTTTVLTNRTTYTINPRTFVSALTQYSSSSRTLSTNARFRWEYRPGSEMFIVYSDGRDTSLDGFPMLANRAFIVKINRLFRF